MKEIENYVQLIECINDKKTKFELLLGFALKKILTIRF